MGWRIQCGRWLHFYNRKVKLLDAVVCRERFGVLGLPVPPALI